MRRFAKALPITTGAGLPARWAALGVSYMGTTIDLFEPNYTCRRLDDRPLIAPLGDFRAHVPEAGELLLYRDALVTDATDDALVTEAAAAGVLIHVTPSGTLADAIAYATTVGATSVHCQNADDCAVVRVAGLSSAADSADDLEPDVTLVDTTDIDLYAEAETIVSLCSSSWRVLAIGSNSDVSAYARAMAINADAVVCTAVPKIYMGEKLEGFVVDNTTWVFATDLGTVYTDAAGASWRVRNELTTCVDHGLTAPAALTVYAATADTAAELDITAGECTYDPVPYTNNLTLKRYVRFFASASGTCTLNYQLADDSDTISYRITQSMVDKLPEWMIWRTNGDSLAWKMTNIAGAALSEFDNAIEQTKWAMLQNFPAADVCGIGYASYVGTGYYPAATTVSATYAQAATINEFMLAAFPCYMLIDDQMVYNVTLANTEQMNLWTPLDEWGLLLDCERHSGETLARFRDRLLDVFAHDVAGTVAGLAAALRRELDPTGLDVAATTFTPNGGVVKIVELDDPTLKDSHGFPTTLLERAVTLQHDKGLPVWDEAKASRSIWNADGPNHLASDRLPYRLDTPLTALTGLTGSGAGPKADLAATLRRDRKVGGTLSATQYGKERTDVAHIMPIEVAYKIVATGTRPETTPRPIHYTLGVKVTWDDETSHSVYGKIEAVATSNASPGNGMTNGATTQNDIHDVIESTGDLTSAIAWFTAADCATPYLFVTTPTVEQITAVTTWISAAHYDDDNTSIFTEVAGSNAISGEAAVSIRANEDAAWATGIAEGNAIAINAAGGESINVRVAPLLPTNATFYNAAAAWSAEIKATAEVNAALDANGAYVANPALVAVPSFALPTDVVLTKYTASIMAASPGAEQALADSELTTIANQTTITFAQANGTPKGAPANETNDLTTYPNIRITSVDGGAAATTYSAPEYEAWTGTPLTFDVSALAVGESALIGSERVTFDPTPAGVTVEGIALSVTDNGNVVPGLVASRTDDGSIIVTRVPCDADLTVELAEGFYWLGADEKYHYVGTDEVAMAEDDTEATLTDILRDSLVTVPGYVYRFDYDENGKTFDPTVKIAGNGTKRLYLPHRDISNVTVDAAPVVATSDDTGTWVELADNTDPAVLYEVSYHLDNSFHVTDETLTLSDVVAAGGITVRYQKEHTADEATSVSLVPTAFWDDRFFLAYSDTADPTAVSTAAVHTEHTDLRTGALPGGIVDAALVWVEATDAAGGPVVGATVVWGAVAKGALSNAETTTNAEGRACAYYTCATGEPAATTQAITATVGGQAATSATLRLLPEHTPGAPGYEWLAVYSGPTSIRDQVAAAFTFLVFNADGTPMTADVAYSISVWVIDKEGNYIADTIEAGASGTMTPSNGVCTLTYTNPVDHRGLYVMSFGPAGLRTRTIAWRVY